VTPVQGAEATERSAVVEGMRPTATLGRGWWRNDLYDFSGLDNVGAQVMEDTAGGWVPAP
jgi:hypothetical protein